VNVWLWAATALLMLFVPLGSVVLFSARIDAFVAMQTTGSLGTLIFVLLAEGFGRSSYATLALVSALLTFVGGLVFLRFFAREHEL
jgi:multisubunit Na+/H+ antiporter MnhF subunit